MIRFLGALMIFAACTAVGFSASAMYLKRVRQLEAFVQLVSYIGAQIDGFLTPLERIYASFENRTLEECSFLVALRGQGGVAAMQICRRSLNLTKNERGELLRFFEGLGQHSAYEEARYCAYYERRIEELAKAARAEYPSKSRVCRTLGVLLGLMLALVLL